MTHRYAARKDKTQSQLMKDLRACGYFVRSIGEPVDLLVRHSSWPLNTWCLLEAKTPGRKFPRADQPDQAQFCRDHGVPYVFDVEQALVYLKAMGRASAQDLFATSGAE
jgi:hypothetical protein